MKEGKETKAVEMTSARLELRQGYTKATLQPLQKADRQNQQP